MGLGQLGKVHSPSGHTLLCEFTSSTLRIRTLFGVLVSVSVHHVHHQVVQCLLGQI